MDKDFKYLIRKWLLENICHTASQNDNLRNATIIAQLEQGNIVDENCDPLHVKSAVSKLLSCITNSQVQKQQASTNEKSKRKRKMNGCRLLTPVKSAIVDCEVIRTMLPATSATAYNCSLDVNGKCFVKLSSAISGMKEAIINLDTKEIEAISGNGRKIDTKAQVFIEKTYTSSADLHKKLNVLSNLFVCNTNSSPSCHTLLVERRKCKRCYDLTILHEKKVKRRAYFDGKNQLLSQLNDIAPEFKEFVEQQVERSLQTKNAAYCPSTLNTLLRLYIRDPCAYADLRESKLIGDLPCPKTLARHKNKVQARTGINKEFLQWMSDEAVSKNVTSTGRVGGLIIDEMSIQPELSVRAKSGGEGIYQFIGVVKTDQYLPKMHTNKSEKLADHLLQFLFTGYQGFSFPACAYPVRGVTSIELYHLTLRLIDALKLYGFRVEYVSVDGAAANRKLIEMATKRPVKNKSYTARNISDPSHTITWIMDPKHCIKKIRNSLESSRCEESAKRTINTKNGLLVWDYWIHLYNWSCNETVAIAKSLTNEHIYLGDRLKMRNHLAEEIYKSSLRNGDHLTAVIELLEHTQHLVSVFNERHRPIRTNSDARLKSLQDNLNYFKAFLELPRNRSFTKPCLQDIACCIEGTLELLSITLGRHQAVNLGYLNSDIIENYFCQLRTLYNGAATNPSYAAVLSIHNAAVISQPKSLPGKPNGNTYIASPPPKKAKLE